MLEHQVIGMNQKKFRHLHCEEKLLVRKRCSRSLGRAREGERCNQTEQTSEGVWTSCRMHSRTFVGSESEF